MKKGQIIRVDKDFSKELKKMKLARMRNGKDEMMKSDRELTRAIRRHILFPEIEQSIIKASELPSEQ